MAAESIVGPEVEDVEKENSTVDVAWMGYVSVCGNLPVIVVWV